MDEKLDITILVIGTFDFPIKTRHTVLLDKLSAFVKVLGLTVGANNTACNFYQGFVHVDLLFSDTHILFKSSPVRI